MIFISIGSLPTNTSNSLFSSIPQRVAAKISSYLKIACKFFLNTGLDNSFFAYTLLSSKQSFLLSLTPTISILELYFFFFILFLNQYLLLLFYRQNQYFALLFYLKVVVKILDVVQILDEPNECSLH